MMDSVLILISNTERLSQNKALQQEEFFLLSDYSTEEIGALAMGRERDVGNMYYLLDCRSRFWKAGNTGST